MHNYGSDIEVLWISRFDYKYDWVLDNHYHEGFYQLIYLVEGNCEVCIDDRIEKINAPAILFFKPAVIHGLRNIGIKGLCTLDTKFKIFNEMLAKYCDVLPSVIKTSDEMILSLLEDIRKEGLKLDMLYRENCQFLFGQVLVRLIRSLNMKEKRIMISIGKGPMEISDVSSELLKYIHNNYFKRITSIDLEQTVSYTYRHILKVFRKDLGLTPMEYLYRYRIEKAMELLSFGDYELKYVAEILGFNNIHDFSRVFKKIAGVPPGKWKYDNNAGICKDISINPNFKNKNLISVVVDE